MITFPYNRLQFAAKPKAMLISLPEMRRGDCVYILGQYNRIALFYVGEIWTQNETATLYEGDKGHSVGTGIDEITDIPLDAKFIVFRKFKPAKKKCNLNN